MKIHPLIDQITHFRKIVVLESQNRYHLNPSLKAMCDSLPFDTPVLIKLDEKGEIKPEILSNPVNGWRVSTDRSALYLSVFSSEQEETAAKKLAADVMAGLFEIGAISSKDSHGESIDEIQKVLDQFTKKTIWESTYRFMFNKSHVDVFNQLSHGACYLVSFSEDGALDGKILNEEPGGLRVRVENIYVYLSCSEEEVRDPDGKRKILERHTSLIKAGFYLPNVADIESFKRHGKG